MEAVVLPAAKIENGVRRMGKQILNQYMLICVESVQKSKIPYPADVKAYIWIPLEKERNWFEQFRSFLYEEIRL